VNVDLMFAIPTQTMVVWRATLREAVALGSEHLSCYEVIYEEDTPLYAQLHAGRFAVEEQLACDMYDLLVDTMAEHNFQQYEIANFARRLPGETSLIPKRACRHNVNYWRGGAFYGLGPSATGYVDGVRTKNWSNTTLYCELLESGKPPAESREKLSSLARAGETAAFGLRMTAGWPFADFHAVTGFDLREQWAPEMQDALTKGLAERDDSGFRLTRRGLRFADLVAEEFLRPESAIH